jgi:hypothetical protein
MIRLSVHYREQSRIASRVTKRRLSYLGPHLGIGTPILRMRREGITGYLPAETLSLRRGWRGHQRRRPGAA